MKPDSTTPYRTKQELAAHFRVSVSTVEEWARRKIIPVHKPSARKNLYHLYRCEAALDRFEIKEVGRPVSERNSRGNKCTQRGARKDLAPPAQTQEVAL